ncbi:MAG TPA: hypothetical protein VGX48_11945 [Pyrinomonadaceae bacterium]|jgi:hypothetical protein|nr:hypothetical protein [Pyrinomonadaceae bacterium]
MRDRLRRARHLVAVAAVLLTAAAATPAAHADCGGQQPGQLLGELLVAVQTPTGAYKYTWWPKCLEPYFNPWRLPENGGGGSQNLPTIAAAVGLFRHPTALMRDREDTTTSTVKYTQWWFSFFESQLGDSPPVQPRLRFMRGTEAFSATYDGPVVASVVAVRYWAQKNKTSANAEVAAAANRIEGLARRYLRATWAIYGMAAGSGPGRMFEVPGRIPTSSPSDPVPADTHYNPWMLLRPTLDYRYSGHLIALAGARTNIAHWAGDSRPPLLDRAIQYTPGRTDENPPQRDLLDYLQPRWPALAENLYALNSDDRTALNTLRDSGTNAAGFLPWLANVRTSTTFRILGWPGWRASLMETNTNWFSANTYGATYRASDQTLTILFPWTDSRSAPADGWCRLEPGLMKASNEGSTDPRQPVKYVQTAIPTATPQFHLVLSKNTEPYLEATPAIYFPPPPAPERDWPRNY